ncbi:MAG: SprT-like domain-containing protein [Nitrospirales bacterium]
MPLSSVQAMWQDLACRFFENRLPAITIEWSSRLTASTGLFVSQVGPRSRWVSSAYRHGEARVIRLSAPLLRGQPEAELQGTLAHEMIHQWEFDIRKRRPSHGPTFREMMDRMNEAGLGITIRHQLNETVNALNRYAWECVHCGMVYHRQRRTILPARHLCSRCRGKLVEVPLEKPEMVDQDILKVSNRVEPCPEPLCPQQLCFHF